MELLMKHLLIVLLLSGCATSVPVTVRFPDAPGQSAMVPCPQLEKIPDYACAVKSDAWIEWYHIQKKIFEGAK